MRGVTGGTHPESLGADSPCADSLGTDPESLTRRQALLHLDVPFAHVFLVDGSSNDKLDDWYLETSATHHMTGRAEFFFELNCDVRGSIKFSDASAVEIKGVGSAHFIANMGEHRLLTDIYFIPTLWNSTISLGQLDKGGSHMEIDSRVLRIWDRRQRLLVKVNRGKNRVYVLHVEVASHSASLLTAMMKLGGGTSALGTCTSRP